MARAYSDHVERELKPCVVVWRDGRQARLERRSAFRGRQLREHLLRHGDDRPHERLLESVLRDLVADDAREVVAVVVEDVVRLGLPLALQSVRRDPLLELLLRDGGRPQIKGHLGEVLEHVLHHGDGPRLDDVAVKVFRAVQSDADVRDHGQLFAARQRQHLGQLAADVIHRTFHRVAALVDVGDAQRCNG